MDSDKGRTAGDEHFSREERALLWGVGGFIGLVVLVSLVRWLWGGAGGGPEYVADDDTVRVVEVERSERVENPRERPEGAKGGTIVVAADAPPPAPGEKVDAFLLALGGGDFAALALEGTELFAPDVSVPDAETRFAAFRRVPLNDGRDDAYVLYFDRDERETRALVLVLDRATGAVRDFRADALGPDAALDAFLAPAKAGNKEDRR